MDLSDLGKASLYFDPPPPVAVDNLLRQAEGATESGAELALLKAHLLAPENLSVLLALYRHYRERGDLGTALVVAERGCRIAGGPLGFPDDWRELEALHLGRAVVVSMGRVRFYLLALKASAYLCLRLGRLDEGYQRLCRVRRLDERDRLGAGSLLNIFRNKPEAYPPPAGS